MDDPFSSPCLSDWLMLLALIYLCLGLCCRKTPTACLPMHWPLSLPPASCAAQTPSIHCRVCKTLAKPQRMYPTNQLPSTAFSPPSLPVLWRLVFHFSSSTECVLFFFCRCVELIIGEQMNKYKARLKDINSLEFAENKAKNRLTLIRRSMVRA